RFSPDGQRVVTGGDSFRTDAGPLQWERYRRFPGQRPFPPSGSGEVRIWDVATGKQLCPPLVMNGGVRQLTFSSDGRRRLAIGGDEACVWDARTGKQLIPPLKHRGIGYGRTLPNAGFNPDGRLLVTAGFDGSIRIWDSTTGDVLGSDLSRSGNGTY